MGTRNNGPPAKIRSPGFPGPPPNPSLSRQTFMATPSRGRRLASCLGSRGPLSCLGTSSPAVLLRHPQARPLCPRRVTQQCSDNVCPHTYLTDATPWQGGDGQLASEAVSLGTERRPGGRVSVERTVWLGLAQGHLDKGGGGFLFEVGGGVEPSPMPLGESLPGQTVTNQGTLGKS